MIDKEKLLKEFTCMNNDHCVEYQCKHHRNSERLTVSECIYKVIKNFPEEPTIDFDLLYDEYYKGLNIIKHGMPYVNARADDFCEFLKSKNLTHPQVDMNALRNEIYSNIQKPREIPVNRTWVMKPEIHSAVTDLGAIGTSFTIKTSAKPAEHLLKYYDYHEDVDYSVITKDSIVEFIVNGKTFFKKLVKFEFGFFSCETTCEGVRYDVYSTDNFVRVVEWAKEVTK